jgi:hypothetical protein
LERVVMEIEDPSIQSFLAQFEPDGADYLYRSPWSLEPIRVTAAERQAFLDDYARRVPSLIWILLGGILTSTVFMLVDLSVLHVPHGLKIDIAAYAASFIAWGYSDRHLMNAPERALRYRIPPRERLRWFERYKRALAAQSWRGMVLERAYLVFLVLWVTSGQPHNPMMRAFALAAGIIFLAQFGLDIALKLWLSSSKL